MDIAIWSARSGTKMDITTIQFVGMWIRDSKPKPALPIPHFCIMDAYGVECQKCEELLEWNAILYNMIPYCTI